MSFLLRVMSDGVEVPMVCVYLREKKGDMRKPKLAHPLQSLYCLHICHLEYTAFLPCTRATMILACCGPGEHMRCQICDLALLFIFLHMLCYAILYSSASASPFFFFQEIK